MIGVRLPGMCHNPLRQIIERLSVPKIPMAPSFVAHLLGYRNGIPNIADGDSLQSVAIASALLKQLGIEHEGPSAGQTAGGILEEGVRETLAALLPAACPLRRWSVDRRRRITDFRQYQHLAALDRRVKDDPTLRVEIGQDYLVEPDVTVGISDGSAVPWLHAAVSCKFTIRSDRVQNIRHEGVILTRHRRGRQPHVVTVTCEPLPSRLASIARGTGEVDAVYHVCLRELEQAVAWVGNVKQQATLDELVGQGRLFDLSELVNVLAL